MSFSSIRRGQWAGLAAAVLFGCSAPLISTLTGTGSALSIAGLLYAGAAVALLAVRLVCGTRAETPVSRRDGSVLAALTLLGGVVGPVAFVLGLARLSPAAGSLLLNLEAVFTLAIAILLGREHLGRRGLLSAGLTIVGAVLLSEGSLAGASWIGGGLIALATLAWGIDNNLSQRLSLRDPLQIATLKAAGASLPMLGLACCWGSPSRRYPRHLPCWQSAPLATASRSGSTCWHCATWVRRVRRCCSPRPHSSARCSRCWCCAMPPHPRCWRLLR